MFDASVSSSMPRELLCGLRQNGVQTRFGFLAGSGSVVPDCRRGVGKKLI